MPHEKVKDKQAETREMKSRSSSVKNQSGGTHDFNIPIVVLN